MEDQNRREVWDSPFLHPLMAGFEGHYEYQGQDSEVWLSPFCQQLS